MSMKEAYSQAQKWMSEFAKSPEKMQAFQKW